MGVNLFGQEVSEHSEQATLCQYLEAKRVPYFAIPNGIFLKDKKTASLIIAKQKKEGMKKGVPDLFIPLANKKYHGLFIEMKKKHGSSATKEQRAWIDLLRKNGYRAEVCKGFRSALYEVNSYLAEMKNN